MPMKLYMMIRARASKDIRAVDKHKELISFVLNQLQTVCHLKIDKAIRDTEPSERDEYGSTLSLTRYFDKRVLARASYIDRRQKLDDTGMSDDYFAFECSAKLVDFARLAKGVFRNLCLGFGAYYAYVAVREPAE